MRKRFPFNPNGLKEVRRSAHWLMIAVTMVLIGLVVTLVDLKPQVEDNFFFSSSDPQFQESKKIDKLFPAGDQLIALVKAAGGFALFFLVTQGLRERADVWLVIAAIAATGVIQAVMTVVPVMTGKVEVSDATRAIGTLSDPNLFAGYLVLVAALSVTVALAVRRRWSIPAAGFITGQVVNVDGGHRYH